MNRTSRLLALAVAVAAAGCSGAARGGAATDEPGAGPPAAPPDVTAPTESVESAESAEPVDAPAQSGEAAAILTAHNRVRARHCARPLVWSEDLAATAQQWADSLRDTGCRFEHSNTGYGENLAAGTRLSAENAVELWAQEAEQYDFRRPSFSSETGHFTQMVWRGTRMIGCGASECRGMRLWVCHYDPPGNVLSLFADNVFAPGCH